MAESAGIDSYRIIKFVEIDREDGKELGVRGYAAVKDDAILQCFRLDGDPGRAIAWLKKHLGGEYSMPNMPCDEETSIKTGCF